MNSPDRFGHTAAMYALLSNIETLIILLENNADITVQNTKGETVLHKLVQWSRNPLDTFDLLQAAPGFDGIKHVCDNEGFSPIDLAAKQRKVLLMRKMYEAGFVVSERILSQLPENLIPG